MKALKIKMTSQDVGAYMNLQRYAIDWLRENNTAYSYVMMVQLEGYRDSLRKTVAYKQDREMIVSINLATVSIMMLAIAKLQEFLPPLERAIAEVIKSATWKAIEADKRCRQYLEEMEEMDRRLLE